MCGLSPLNIWSETVGGNLIVPMDVGTAYRDIIERGSGWSECHGTVRRVEKEKKMGLWERRIL
ncbi:MAG TPA: hypothetical protein VEI46_09520 [Thermodesulfovibrionales bacterium]|nr:hypothetical protein [Thermodesulfovibrionales bacterium]